MKALKWIGIALGGLLVLALLVGGVLYFVGGGKWDRAYEVPTADLTVPSDSASIARGARLARTNGCTDCHTESLGGQVMVDAPPFRVVAANLTRGKGGLARRYTPEDFDRAIRHGVKANGRAVFIMPSAAFHRMSDDDVAAVIAYLHSVPPVDNELPTTEVRAPGKLLGAFAFDPAFEVRTAAARARRPPVGPTAEYGEYLASITCAYCHGDGLEGAQPPMPGSPPAPPLAAAARWSLGEFAHTLRTGTTPGGRELNPEFMPISLTSQYDDEELAALHAHLGRRFGVAPAAAAPGS